MNGHTDNKYERYALAANWNLTPNGPEKATNFMLCDDAIKGIKMLFGQKLDDNNPDILILERDWGRTNAPIIDLWFQEDKLTPAHKVELCMTAPDNFANQLNDDSDSSNEE